MRLLRLAIHVILFFGFAVVLTACGGGGGGGDAPADPPSTEAIWDQSNWNEKNWQ